MRIQSFCVSLQLFEICCKKSENCKDQGMTFHRKGEQAGLVDLPVLTILGLDTKLPAHPIDTANPKPVCFADAASGNNPTKRRSATGCAVTHCRGATPCQSKAQSTAALISLKRSQQLLSLQQRTHRVSGLCHWNQECPRMAPHQCTKTTDWQSKSQMQRSQLEDQDTFHTILCNPRLERRCVHHNETHPWGDQPCQ